MSNDVIRSFLVSLGFVIKHQEQKTFENTLDGVTKRAVNTGVAITGIATAAQVMVKSFAQSFEHLYYASQRTGSTVNNIKSLQSGAERVGVSAENALGMLEQMSEALNLNPGKRALLEALTGGKTKGMSNDNALIELLRQLKSLPDNVGFGMAQKFGISDYKTYKNMTTNLAEMEEGIKKRNSLNVGAGINGNDFAKASRQYLNTLRDLEDKTSVIGQKIAINLLGPFEDMAKQTNSMLDTIFGLKEAPKNEKTWKEKNWAERMVFSWKNRDKNIDNFKEGKTNAYGNPLGSHNPAQSQDKQKYLEGLESKYGLPKGLLDSMWMQESGRGRRTYNKVSGAEGDFQFMKATQKEFGVKNPYDFYEEGDAAARKMKGLLKHYKGNMKMALSGYNFGEGKLARTGYLGVPSETRKYRDDVANRMGHVTINSKTDIHISGANNPHEIAREIKKLNTEQNSEAIRNMQARIQ